MMSWLTMNSSILIYSEKKIARLMMGTTGGYFVNPCAARVIVYYEHYYVDIMDQISRDPHTLALLTWGEYLLYIATISQNIPEVAHKPKSSYL